MELQRIEIGQTPQNKRDCFEKIKNFINKSNGQSGRIVMLHGLRRTGKTILMKHLAEYFDCDCIYEASKTNTMEDVFNQIRRSKENGEKVIFIDEITKVGDFAENSALLADKYASSGIDIVIAGTDSLGLLFAEDDDLLDRTFRVNTTYISFAEHCRVLNTKDMDEYVQFGGLMRKGIMDGEAIMDEETKNRYLDSAVTGNIVHSLHNVPAYPKYREIRKYSREDLELIIKKTVELYSGVFDTDLFNMDYNKIKTIVYAPIDDFIKKDKKNGIVDSVYKVVNAADIRKIYKDKINMSCNLERPATDKLEDDIRNVLTRINLISVNDSRTYNKENDLWDIPSNNLEIYIIQPAIKYYQLCKAIDTILTSDATAMLSENQRIQLGEQLRRDIVGRITENILLFDTKRSLCSEEKYHLDSKKYVVCKPYFTINGENKGEYDMLVYDASDNKHWCFEVKNTSNHFLGYDKESNYIGQDKNLLNSEYSDLMENYFGKRECGFVLYNGKPFKAPTGTIYLNMTDFLISVDKYGDMDEVITKLTDGIPKRGDEIIERPDVQ